MSGVLALDPAPGILLALGCALLFGHAAWHKWRALADFGAAFAAYRVLQPALARPATVAIPALESLVAAGLLAGRSRPWAAATGAALLLAYAGGIALNLRRGRRDLDCGCAGPASRQPIGAWMVWRNLALALALLALCLPWRGRALATPDALTVGAGLLVAVCLYAAGERLLGSVRPRGLALKGGLN